jgi:hypothetical protein
MYSITHMSKYNKIHNSINKKAISIVNNKAHSNCNNMEWKSMYTPTSMCDKSD